MLAADQLTSTTACFNCSSMHPPAHPQGLPKDERQNEGRVPRPIDVELAEDLVDSCMPGDVVSVVGVVKVINGEGQGGGWAGRRVVRRLGGWVAEWVPVQQSLRPRWALGCCSTRRCCSRAMIGWPLLH